eukprot:CAMPEP_0114581878 /NCGR_PEP_ID=MMETSP0125-20121206/5939_1 /TAXON_ID=485358 ORGANISM="Aristerostoma sp., Strain ATCC 50986" /NCGR_SAMPLE_ID=MMETSP0125 /ASSEMBLY_ACC=CAM_ASM_000245 /LENGTH=65 /DNA_ID=CAMNT_0001774431 /DNA_START=894 /DNA_END=1091 /DNA_ORIENTATION=-
MCQVDITGSEYYVPFILGDNQDSLQNWINRLKNLLGWNYRKRIIDFDDVEEEEDQPNEVTPKIAT